MTPSGCVRIRTNFSCTTTCRKRLGGAEEDSGAGHKPAPFLFSARSDIKVGLALPRRPSFPKNECSDVLACLSRRGSASIAALTVGEIRANRQVCPTIVWCLCQSAPLFPWPCASAQVSLNLAVDFRLTNRAQLTTNTSAATELHPRNFPPRTYICVGNFRSGFSPVSFGSFFYHPIKR